MKAMEKVDSLIAVRERCCKELATRLAKAGFSPEEVEDAVETSVRVGLVSDERYTRAYIRGKTRLGWGRKKVVMRLRADGIEEGTIETCSDEFPSEEEDYERALKILGKRKASSANPYASYMRRLVGKGFSYEVSSRAVSEQLRREREEQDL